MSQTKTLTERSMPARIPDFCRSSSNQRTKWPGSIVAFYRWEYWSKQRTTRPPQYNAESGGREAEKHLQEQEGAMGLTLR